MSLEPYELSVTRFAEAELEQLRRQTQVWTGLLKPGYTSPRDHDLEAAGLQGIVDLVWVVVRDIHNISWFSRVWVIQEAAYCSRMTVLLGPLVVDWEALFGGITQYDGDSNRPAGVARSDPWYVTDDVTGGKGCTMIYRLRREITEFKQYEAIEYGYRRILIFCRNIASPIRLISEIKPLRYLF